MELFKTARNIIIIGLIFLAFTLCSFGYYSARTLDGNADNHILASEMFGTPEELKDRGVKPLYKGEKQTGWDGQFYYYMSNDILALKDTPNHIDAPSYRYQRIGMSLYAAIFSKVIGMDWVSPKTYLISYLLLILAATLCGAYLFIRLGAHPALILFWSLGIGTQVTMFNALPDAAADAFLILALTAVLKKRYILSALPFVFAALSREVYVLFPSFILLFLLWELIRKPLKTESSMIVELIERLIIFRSWYFLALPGLTAIGWHIYVVQHFGVSPSEQADGILGFPLVAWWDYFLSGISGNHKLVGTGINSYAEAASLFLFLLVLISALWVSISAFINRKERIEPLVGGVAVTVICFVLLYISFGPTVIMHYTGYFKAIAVMFFVIPFLIAYLGINSKRKYGIYSLLLVGLLVTTLYNMKVRILPFNKGLDQYTNVSQVTEDRRVECFERYDSEVRVSSFKIKKRDVFDHVFGTEDLIVIDLEIINTSKHSFISSRNFGSVHVSYHWVNSQGVVVGDGIRSAILNEIHPGQTFSSTIVTTYPESTDDIFLKPSLVQEGCAWFYMATPADPSKVPVISITR
jgi:hypothetical protein